MARPWGYPELLRRELARRPEWTPTETLEVLVDLGTDVYESSRGDGSFCPLARAIQRTIGRCGVVVHVGPARRGNTEYPDRPDGVYIRTFEMRAAVRYVLPDEVLDTIRRWDVGTAGPDDWRGLGTIALVRTDHADRPPIDPDAGPVLTIELGGRHHG